MLNTHAQIGDVLKKAFRGELIDTRFCLYTARSKREGKATKPRGLFANDEALAASSGYFCGLLFPLNKSFDGPALIELQDHRACEEAISLRDYGYDSDSDLEEEEEETSATLQDNAKPLSVSEDRALTQTASIKDFATEGTRCILPGRSIVVTDTAFKTWEALLYYLHTGEIAFAPLRSQPDRIATSGTFKFYTPPSCSPKSMYRLACKIKHGVLQDKALAAIRFCLTEHNIIQELSSSLASRFPAIHEMEVEVLFQHVATPTIMKDLPKLIQRIVGGDLPHGADILIQLGRQMLRSQSPAIFCPSPLPVTLNMVGGVMIKQKGKATVKSADSSVVMFGKPQGGRT